MTYQDDPDFDGTDGAHPAWWRGCEHGVRTTAKIMQTWLNREDHRGVYGWSTLNDLRQQILAMKAVVMAAKAHTFSPTDETKAQMLSALKALEQISTEQSQDPV